MNDLNNKIQTSEYKINRWTNESKMPQYKTHWPRLKQQIQDEKIKLESYRRELAQGTPQVSSQSTINKPVTIINNSPKEATKKIQDSEYRIQRWTEESKMPQYQSHWPRLKQQIQDEKVKLEGYKKLSQTKTNDNSPKKETEKVELIRYVHEINSQTTPEQVKRLLFDIFTYSQTDPASDYRAPWKFPPLHSYERSRLDSEVRKYHDKQQKRALAISIEIKNENLINWFIKENPCTILDLLKDSSNENETAYIINKFAGLGEKSMVEHIFKKALKKTYKYNETILECLLSEGISVEGLTERAKARLTSSAVARIERKYALKNNPVFALGTKEILIPDIIKHIQAFGVELLAKDNK